MNDLHASFKDGAASLTRGSMKYTELHRAHGIMEADWALLTNEEPWTPNEARQIRTILASIVEICLTISGLPPVPLPGQYVAAVIAICVAPANRFVAAQKVPQTFDAAAASGLEGSMEIKEMKTEQMIALVLAYSGGYGGEPLPRLIPEVNEMRKKGNEK
jgi:hypothetical protein